MYSNIRKKTAAMGCLRLDYCDYRLFGSDCRRNLAGPVSRNSVVEFCNVSYF